MLYIVAYLVFAAMLVLLYCTYGALCDATEELNAELKRSQQLRIALNQSLDERVELLERINANTKDNSEFVAALNRYTSQFNRITAILNEVNN